MRLALLVLSLLLGTFLSVSCVSCKKAVDKGTQVGSDTAVVQPAVVPAVAPDASANTAVKAPEVVPAVKAPDAPKAPEVKAPAAEAKPEPKATISPKVEGTVAPTNTTEKPEEPAKKADAPDKPGDKPVPAEKPAAGADVNTKPTTTATDAPGDKPAPAAPAPAK